MLKHISHHIYTGVKNALDFGGSTKIQKIERTHFVSFFLKVLLMIVPAILLGHYTDEYVRKLQDANHFGSEKWKYIVLQTVASIFVVYLIYRLFHPYSDEFQTTSAGLFFSALFWSVQTRYVQNIKDVLSID